MKIIVLGTIKEFHDSIRGKLTKGIDVSHYYNEKDAEKEIGDAEVIFCSDATREFLEKAKKLKWVHTPWIGADNIIKNIPAGVTLTRTIGVNDEDISRYVCTYILYFTQKVKERIDYQEKRLWDKMKLLEEFSGNAVGVIGLGSIGQKIAEVLHNLGFEVYGYKKNTPDRDFAFIKQIYYGNEKQTMLSQCDFVVVCLPLSDDTKNFISGKELDSMKKSCVLINVGRGGTIDEDALIEALENKKIKAAVLDVTREEPLPQNSRLWGIDNLIITPHVSGLFRFDERAAFFKKNLARYMNNQQLEGIVELKKGY
ncbi:D-2-hydroxyacid dehydrogenase [Candidatus Woesearchaeota archaeon]|nr:D-2-hydroxyacid dehydrogenase [Candidatus Woesearchaeota archaeon]